MRQRWKKTLAAVFAIQLVLVPGVVCAGDDFADGRDGIGWKVVEQGWIYEDVGQVRVRGWRKLVWNGEEKWYFFDDEGIVKTGWLMDESGGWYFLGEAGGMFCDAWIRSEDGRWYYVDADGRMLTSARTPDGYWVDEAGVWSVEAGCVTGPSNFGAKPLDSALRGSAAGGNSSGSGGGRLESAGSGGIRGESSGGSENRDDSDGNLGDAGNHLVTDAEADSLMTPPASGSNAEVGQVVGSDGEHLDEDVKNGHVHSVRTDILPATCSMDGVRTELCVLCETYIRESVLPKTGHLDVDGDFQCDQCGCVMDIFSVGDRQKVRTGLDGEYQEMTFICLDTNYKGGILFVSEEVIPYEVSSAYGGGSYGESEVREWLNLVFADGLSVADNILPVRLGEVDDSISDMVFCVSKAEAENGKYKRHLMGSWDSGEGTAYYWTRSPDREMSDFAYAVSSSGHMASLPVDSAQVGVRPAYVLRNPYEEPALHQRWMEGDVQERVIGGVRYDFRCIDPDYADGMGRRNGALFLCDQIIGSGGKVYSETGDSAWEGSGLRTWMAENLDSEEGLEESCTTVRQVYAGTSNYYEAGVAGSAFTKSTLRQWEESWDMLFCLSLEEAVRYRRYLWRLDGSGKENFIYPGDDTSGYWLRTGHSFNGGEAYCVSYDGRISATATDNTRIGFRPAFVARQEWD